jgi:hypothetical protein
VFAFVGCSNPLQNFIYDSLLGVPYRREMGKVVPTPNLGSYGFAVDIAGDYMIVGEPNRDGGRGGAWIYHRTSGETWDAGQKLDPPGWATGPATSNANDGDQFGMSVAIGGDWAAIGSMYAGVDLTTPGKKRGQVALYSCDAVTGSWSLSSTIDINASVPGGTAVDYDLFGNAISIDGSWMAIGSRQDHLIDTTSGADKYGAVYLFQNVGGKWTFKEKKTATVPQANASFGFSVDLQSDLLIVGSHREDVDGTSGTPSQQGAAYIFRFDTDNWQMSDRITAPIPADMAQFGVGVAISGGYALVGEPTATVDGTAQAGAAYFFQRTGADDWHTVPATKVTAVDPAASDWFGFSTAMKGDTAMVGDFLRDAAGVDSGQVYVYGHSTGNTWDLAGTISPSDATDNSYFGISLSMDGTRAVIGATAAPPAADKGAVYLFK